jgi:3-oxoadipate enol-lactonase
MHNRGKAGGIMPSIKVNEVELFYTEQGSGVETIVFAHGLLMDNSMWDLVAPEFADRYRVICFDFRGQGQSRYEGNGFSIDALVEDTAGLIRSLADGPVHYVGLSMGGMVGMPLAARHPDLIRSMVLLDTSAQAEPAKHKIKYAMMTAIVKTFGVKVLTSRTLPLMFGVSTMKNPAKRELVNHWRHKLDALQKSITGPVSGVTKRRDVTEELGKITCPTLVMVGEEDQTTSVSCADHIHANIANSELKIIAECGHSSALEKPEQVVAAMKKFYLQFELA